MHYFRPRIAVDRSLDEAHSIRTNTAFAGVIYAAAFTTGAMIMSFQMLGSRYLTPYFGSGIYPWAAFTPPALPALSPGYFAGGELAARPASPAVLACTVMIASGYLLA